MYTAKAGNVLSSNVAPESLSAEFKVSGNGLGAAWDTDDKFDRIDAFLEKHGVN